MTSDQEPYEPIGCKDYDYIELACLDRYQVDVVTNQGPIRGLAAGTKTDDLGEYLVIENAHGVQTTIRADHIRKLVVLSEPRRFDEWIFEGTLDS